MNEHFLVREDGKIAGLLCAYNADMDVMGKKLKTCGIGTVCVLPEYRNQKVGDTLMRMLIWIGFEFGPELYVKAEDDIAGFFTKYGFAETEEKGVYKLAKANYACGCCSHA